MSFSCLRVFVADSQPVFRAGVLNALCAQEDLVAVGEAGTADALVDAVVSLRPDVLVVDGGLLDRQLLARLNEACRPLATAMLVVAPPWSAPFVGLVADGLVQSCVLRTLGRASFVDAIRRVGRGERVTSDGIETYLSAPMPGDLTIRELSVLALAAEGFSNTAIAGELRISPSYVNAQVRRLLQKLNARDRTHAVILGFRHGLLDPG